MNYTHTVDTATPALLRVEEFARMVAISVPTVRAWIATGRLSIVRLGRTVRIPVSEVDRVVREGLVAARPDGRRSP